MKEHDTINWNWQPKIFPFYIKNYKEPISELLSSTTSHLTLPNKNKHTYFHKNKREKRIDEKKVSVIHEKSENELKCRENSRKTMIIV